MEDTKFSLKEKFGLILLGVIAIFAAGYYTATTDLKGEKVNAYKLGEKIDDSEAKLKHIEKEIDKKQDKLAEAEKIINHKEDLEKKIDKLNSDLKDKKVQIAALDDKISSKQNELDSLSGEVKAKKAAPKTLTAGQFVVGKDVPAGRYKAVPVGEGSNFIVYDGTDGSAKVNTILGDFGQKSYVFSCSDGDKIQTEAEVQLIPVQ